MTPEPGPGDPMRVGVIVLTFNPERELLLATLTSVLKSNGLTGTVLLGELLVVDNASTNNVAEQLVTELLAQNQSVQNQFVQNQSAQNQSTQNQSTQNQRETIRFIQLPDNRGFAAGTNAGLQALNPGCNAVLLLNPDATVAENAIALLAIALSRAEKNVLSVAPKMLLTAAAKTIDAVGNAINAKGEGANIGLGQPDVGQFDSPANIFGPCFGAALFRREAFSVEHVGLLDEQFFLYYEDVDWNCRAQLLGYDSIREPSAVVHHQMSSTTRHLSYDFKFCHTERNLLLTALKNYSWRRVVVIWFTRGAGLLLGSVKGHYPIAGLKAIFGAMRRVPRSLQLRRSIQRRRIRSDQDLIAYSIGNRTFFDAVRYELLDRNEATRYAHVLLSTASGKPRNSEDT
jgi:GT2 family glycosyltransferase